MAVLDMAQFNDALLIQVDPGMTPMCTFVPRQLNREQMTSLFPESWITKYEMLHQAAKPIQSNTPLFIRKENGEVETKLDRKSTRLNSSHRIASRMPSSA